MPNCGRMRCACLAFHFWMENLAADKPPDPRQLRSRSDAPSQPLSDNGIEGMLSRTATFTGCVKLRRTAAFRLLHRPQSGRVDILRRVGLSRTPLVFEHGERFGYKRRPDVEAA